MVSIKSKFFYKKLFYLYGSWKSNVYVNMSTKHATSINNEQSYRNGMFFSDIEKLLFGIILSKYLVSFVDNLLHNDYKLKNCYLEKLK